MPLLPALPTPDADGHWKLAAHYTLHLDLDHPDGQAAVIRGKHGPLTTIPVDELLHIGGVMLAAAERAKRVAGGESPIRDETLADVAQAHLAHARKEQP